MQRLESFSGSKFGYSHSFSTREKLVTVLESRKMEERGILIQRRLLGRIQLRMKVDCYKNLKQRRLKIRQNTERNYRSTPLHQKEQGKMVKILQSQRRSILIAVPQEGRAIMLRDLRQKQKNYRMVRRLIIFSNLYEQDREEIQ